MSVRLWTNKGCGFESSCDNSEQLQAINYYHKQFHLRYRGPAAASDQRDSTCACTDYTVK